MGKIFISYRRDDSDKTCEAIYQRLTARFGKGSVFRDTYSIPFGEDFRQYIIRELQQCDIQLVVIGPRWLTISEGRQRRLDNPDDLVRFEVETALQRGIPVTPVIVDGGEMPHSDQLPEPLRPLPNHHGIILSQPPGIDRKFGKLMTQIAGMLPKGVQDPGWHTVISSSMDGLGFAYRHYGDVAVVVPPVVQVPGGAFQMGSEMSEQETPVREITVPEFSIAVHPVTAGEYSCFVRAGHRHPPDRSLY
jgi:hypothetical protein